MKKSLMLALTLAAGPSLVCAGGFQTGGRVESAKVKAVLQKFVDDLLPIEATVTQARGGWGARGGANPGAALVQGAVALGGLVDVNGQQAELVLAAAKGAVGAREPEKVGRLLVVAGVAGGLRVTKEEVSFPGSAAEAHALFDEVLGAETRAGKEFRKRTISGTTFWGFQEWVPAKNGKGKVRLHRWVSDFQGKTRVGTGAGTGLLARFTPLY